MVDQVANPPSVGLTRRYLLNNGWAQQPSSSSALERFVLRGNNVRGADVEVYLTKASNASSAKKRVLDVLETLSALNDRTVDYMARVVAMLDCDVIQAALPDQMVLRDSIRLRVAEGFLPRIKKLLATAAHAQFAGETAAIRRGIAGDFVNDCRLGHTFRGSYGFTIEAPVGPNPNELDPNASSVINSLAPPPPARRIVEHLVETIQASQDAALQQSSEPIFRQTSNESEFDALSALTNIVAFVDGPQIDFGFEFSEAWLPRLDRKLQFTIPTRALRYMDEVLSTRKASEAGKSERLIGTIYRLQSHEPPNLLSDAGTQEISIDIRAGRLEGATISLRLSPEDYLIAVDAHRDGQAVFVVGKVRRATRGYQLFDQEQFGLA